MQYMEALWYYPTHTHSLINMNIISIIYTAYTCKDLIHIWLINNLIYSCAATNHCFMDLWVFFSHVSHTVFSAFVVAVCSGSQCFIFTSRHRHRDLSECWMLSMYKPYYLGKTLQLCPVCGWLRGGALLYIENYYHLCKCFYIKLFLLTDGFTQGMMACSGFGMVQDSLFYR